MIVMTARLRAQGALASLTAPKDTSLGDARESLAYWQDRHSQLPWHSRAARREAREMVSRCRARLVRAHLDRLGLGWLAAVAEPHLRSRRVYARWLWVVVIRRNPLVRKWLLIATLAAGALAVLGVGAVIVVGAVVF
jgi:hypothetical protein